MNQTPLRQLILIPIVLTVTVGLLALSVFIYESMEGELIEQVDAELTRAQQATVGTVRMPPVSNGDQDRPPQSEESATADQPEQTQIQQEPFVELVSSPVELLISPDGELVEQLSQNNPFGAEEIALIGSRGVDDATFELQTYRIRTLVQPDGNVLVTALDVSSVEMTLSDLRRALIVGSVIVLLAQAVIVWMIASYLARPLAEMTHSARQIADGDLEIPIGEPSGSREMVDLAVDLDQMVLQLRSMVQTSETSAEDARAAREHMQRFLADASHELRTPLTALRGYADLYNASMLTKPDDLDRAMRRIGSESERMTRLVTDMLQLARTNSFAESAMADVDLNALVEGLVLDLSAAQPEAIPTYCGPDAPLSIVGDADHIHQALLSIAANAYHHTPDHTEVRIDLQADDDHARISIADRGDGIDPAIADKIFEPFFQADSSRVADGGARAGLGLAIAHRIIDAHGGTIHTEATDGGGATFVISLPRKGTIVA